MKLLSFDIEISDIFDLKDGEDMEKYAPFHISVAATAVYDGEERVWYSKDGDGRPALNLTQESAHELLEYLDKMQKKGFMVCAWNGLSFDLKWIGHQAGDMALAAHVALKSFDPMFQFFNQRGFPVSLAKVGEGMGIEQVKSMNGADAPKEWVNGNHEAVMKYCLGDCQLTNQIILEIVKKKRVNWITTSNTNGSEPMPILKSVRRVIREPLTDQSWMDHPIPKEKFCGWVQEATEAL